MTNRTVNDQIQSLMLCEGVDKGSISDGFHTFDELYEIINQYKTKYMSVIAKFKCESNKEGTIILHPVYDPNPESENGRFFKYTPGGFINISTVNELAAGQFVPGEEYYVTFENSQK